MNVERPGLKRVVLVVAAAAVAGIVAGTVAVYVRGGGAGNTDAAAVDCAGALKVAERLVPLAHGEVAAFRPADKAEVFTDIAFKAPDGSDISLAAFAGRTVLLNLWATWCVPCRAEMPALDRLQAAVGGDDFAVAAVNVDVREPARAAAFLESIGVTSLALYTDPTLAVFNEMKRRGLAIGLPTTVLIDPKGCRLGILEGPAAWDSIEARTLIDAARGRGNS